MPGPPGRRWCSPSWPGWWPVSTCRPASRRPHRPRRRVCPHLPACPHPPARTRRRRGRRWGRRWRPGPRPRHRHVRRHRHGQESAGTSSAAAPAGPGGVAAGCAADLVGRGGGHTRGIGDVIDSRQWSTDPAHRGTRSSRPHHRRPVGRDGRPVLPVRPASWRHRVSARRGWRDHRAQPVPALGAARADRRTRGWRAGGVVGHDRRPHPDGVPGGHRAAGGETAGGDRADPRRR